MEPVTKVTEQMSVQCELEITGNKAAVKYRTRQCSFGIVKDALVYLVC